MRPSRSSLTSYNVSSSRPSRRERASSAP
jgi:hypothetical protein